MKVSIVGAKGYVGSSYSKVFPKAYLYDLDQGTKEEVNKTDVAIVAVPTDLKEDGTLDMSIVESVVAWLETPLIIIKSALNPTTTDYLVKKYNKKIAVSVEFVGMGNYFIPDQYPNPTDPRQHQMIIVGGEEKTATLAAEVLWENVSPTVKIHIVSALEAEITKMVENFYGALKVTWINTLMSLTDKADANFIKVHQAWASDPRVDSFHQRTLSYKRGWKSHCWSKDPQALATYAKTIGADDMAQLIQTVLDLNERHYKLNG